MMVNFNKEDLITESRRNFIEKERNIKKTKSVDFIDNITVAANAQGLTLVKDDEYENNLNRIVAKDALGNY